MEYLMIDSRSTTPVYLQIVDQIRAHIGKGSLDPGEPLPSVRQLATDLGVNPNTVAKAYMLLEREGTIETVHRRGTFVAEGARTKVEQAADQRLEETVDRLIEEAARLGIDRERFLQTMQRRLGEGRSAGKPREGRSS